MKGRTVKILLLLVAFIIVIQMTMFGVYHIMSNGKAFGSLSEPVISFASFPRLVKGSFSQLFSSVKPYQLARDPSFKPLNVIDRELFLVNSYFDDTNQEIIINLIDVKAQLTLYTWKYTEKNLITKNFSINHPLVYSDSSLVFKIEDGFIIKLDKNSEVVWKNSDFMFHHTLEMDDDGNIWVPSTAEKGSKGYAKIISDLDGDKLQIRDDAITLLDHRNGNVLYRKSVSEILVENGMEGFLIGFWEIDPIHLNDIQPITKSHPGWTNGDLFLSLRNLHMILRYRPSENRVIWYKVGPWISQHDVDIIDSTHLMVFNNNVNLANYNTIPETGEPVLLDTARNSTAQLTYNEVIFYDYKTQVVNDSSFSLLIERENINTSTAGRSELIEKGLVFIEETNEGKIYIGQNNQTLLRQRFVSPDSSYVYYPGWSRIYKNSPFAQ